MNMTKNKRRKMLRVGYCFVLITTMIISGICLNVSGQSKSKTSLKRQKKTTIVKELVNERTENSNTYILSDGSKRVDIYQENIRFRQNNVLKEYDSSLKKLSLKEKGTFKKVKKKAITKDYLAVNTSGDSKQYFPDELDGKKSIIMRKDNYEFSFTPIIGNKKYSSKIDNDSIVYKSDNNISQYQYISQKHGVKETIILESTPKDNEISFEVSAKNMELVLDENSGGIYFKDIAKNYRVGYMMPPNMENAEGEVNYKDVSYKLVKKSHKIILKLIINEDYLENVSYPVKVDPTAVWFSNKLKTAIVSSLSFVRDQCWNAEKLIVKNKCDKAPPYVGTEQRVYLDIHTVVAGNAYVGGQIDWKGKKINEAFLSVAESVTDYKSGTVEVRETSGGWSMESLSWNNQPQIGKVIGCFNSTRIEKNRHKIDLTEYIKEIISLGNVNKGLVFMAKETGTGAGIIGPEIGSGNMFLSIVYDDMESIHLAEYDCYTKKQSEYEFFYENSLNNVTEQPYIPVSQNDLVNENGVLPYVLLPDSDINVVSPTTFPYSAIVHMKIWTDENKNNQVDKGETFIGSGFIIGPDTIVTAAHCIWSFESGWADDIKVYLKYKDGITGEFYHPKTVLSPKAYFDSGNIEYDWAVLKLIQNVGAYTGWLGFSSREMQINRNINVAGYAYNENKKIVQYQSEGPVLDVSQKGINYYSSTKGGQSGGPVFESDFIACGIHHGGSELGKYNNGSRINTCLFSILQKHKLTGKETYGYE